MFCDADFLGKYSLHALASYSKRKRAHLQENKDEKDANDHDQVQRSVQTAFCKGRERSRQVEMKTNLSFSLMIFPIHIQAILHLHMPFACPVMKRACNQSLKHGSCMQNTSIRNMKNERYVSVNHVFRLLTRPPDIFSCGAVRGSEI